MPNRQNPIFTAKCLLKMPNSSYLAVKIHNGNPRKLANAHLINVSNATNLRKKVNQTDLVGIHLQICNNYYLFISVLAHSANFRN